MDVSPNRGTKEMPCNGRLTENHRSLAEAALPLALRVAKSYLRNFRHIGEAEGVAAEAAIRAARSFEAEAGKSADREEAWEKWVKVCARSVALRAIQKEQTRMRALAKRVAAYPPEELDREWRGFGLIENKDELEPVLGCLRQEERALVVAVASGRSVKEVGEILGMTSSTSYRVYTNAIHAMRREALGATNGNVCDEEASDIRRDRGVLLQERTSIECSYSDLEGILPGAVFA